jgi:hypothetical protein
VTSPAMLTACLALARLRTNFVRAGPSTAHLRCSAQDDIDLVLSCGLYLEQLHESLEVGADFEEFGVGGCQRGDSYPFA